MATAAVPYEDDTEVIQKKLSSLPSDLRELFLQTMARVYEEESWSFIDLLQQSRSDMTNIVTDMADEQADLRAATSSLSMKRQMSMQSVNSQGEGAADTARLSHSVSVHKTSEDEESLNEGTRVPGTADEYHEEAEEVMKHKKGIEMLRERERTIQSARLRAKKEEKQAKKKESENKAAELIDRANHITDMQSKDKERQEQKVKDKLAQKREKQKKGSKNTAETSLSNDSWATSYQDSANEKPSSTGNSWSGPRDPATLAEVQN